MTETKNSNHHEKQQPNQFFNGLLVGLILGFGLALLFTTKKGRKMIKVLTEEGLDSISELRKRMDSIEVMLDEEEMDEYFEEEPKTNGVNEKKVIAEKKADELANENEDTAKRGSKRRLFRGISRKN